MEERVVGVIPNIERMAMFASVLMVFVPVSILLFRYMELTVESGIGMVVFLCASFLGLSVFVVFHHRVSWTFRQSAKLAMETAVTMADDRLIDDARRMEKHLAENVHALSVLTTVAFSFVPLIFY